MQLCRIKSLPGHSLALGFGSAALSVKLAGEKIQQTPMY